MITTDIFSELLKVLSQEGLKVQTNVSSAEFNTYRVGGNLTNVITLSSESDIETLSNVIGKSFQQVIDETNVVTIGRGSNILISDQGFNGLTLVIAGELVQLPSSFFDSQNNQVTACAGVPLPVLARQCVAVKASGIEFYVGIPGSVGGAIAMNAGGHGKQTSDVLNNCEVLNLSTGRISVFKSDECDFSYRKSRFKANDLVYKASFNVEMGNEEEVKENINSIVQWRRENQPGGRNVGSVFQNPEDTSAGALIEKCGLKGFRLGSAFVSDKHANFIQADQDAKADDIYSLIMHVQSTVEKETGIVLKTEVRFIGMKQNG